jgi:hypothetical protein
MESIKEQLKAQKKVDDAQRNELALREQEYNNLPAEITAGDWGVVESLETTDLLVPKIFHQQGLSQFVSEGKAKAGDFCDSLTGEVLAGKDEKLEIIVFGSYKTTIVSVYDERAKKFQLKEIITHVPENAKQMAELQQEEDTPEGKIKRNIYYNLFCLLPSKISELPFVLSLGSTKTKAAKKINTMIFKLSQQKKPGAAVVFELTSVQEKNDKGTWYGIEVNQGRWTTPEELLRAHAWHLKSKTQKFNVVEEEESASYKEPEVVNGDHSNHF